MASQAVRVAQAQTQIAFKRGQSPAPYYLFVLMRAQRAGLAAPAVRPGTGNPARAGGSVYVQRQAAAYKGPTATRVAWRQVLVPTRKRTANGRTRYVKVNVRGRQVVVP